MTSVVPQEAPGMRALALSLLMQGLKPEFSFEFFGTTEVVP